MNSQEKDKIKNILKKLPDTPGVYQFLRGKEILYIGKATSLKDRVRSYFNKDIVNTRSPLIAKMLSEFDDIDFIKTDSVLEALILEAKLIKKYQPEANIKEKDNRSFNYVVVTEEDWPRVLVIREREIEKNENEFNKFSIRKTFGPFPNGSQLREAMKIVRKIFPFRDKCIPADEQNIKKSLVLRNFSGAGCFNRQIGLCPGVCTGEISKKEYEGIIKNIILFFDGDKKKIIKKMKNEMNKLAKNKNFEKAGEIKNKIFTLNHIQDISLIKDFSAKIQSNSFDKTFRIESYDIAHMSGRNTVGVMVVLEDGEIKKSDYRKFKIKEDKNNDTDSLKEVIERRLGHNEWVFPDIIVVDGGLAQKSIVEKILKENKLNIPVFSVVKDEYHKPKNILGNRNSVKSFGKWENLERDILLSNYEAHRFAINYHKKLRGKFR